jgi:hypothetical protein
LDAKLEIGGIVKADLKGCPVMPIENPPRSLGLVGNRVLIVHKADNILKNRQKNHILAVAEDQRRNESQDAEYIQLFAIWQQEKTKLRSPLSDELTKLLSDVVEMNK